MDQRSAEISPHKLISSLRGFGLLPAIIFMPTRRKCDESALEVANDRSQPADAEKQIKRQEMFDAYSAENPEIKDHKHAKILLNAGVAAHHAGHIPAWKLLIEKMMSAGLLNAIFATSTVAAGVDFPARTVVITNADTRGNDGWRPLRASELQQMTGRAGRRGRDLVGFVVLVPSQFQDPKKIAELLKAPPDPLESQFRSTYTSLLNLLDAFKSFDQVREIAQKSFAFRSTSHRIDKIAREKARQEAELDEKLAGNSFDLTTTDINAISFLLRVRERLVDISPFSRAELRAGWLRENVQVGRIVTTSRGGKRYFIVLGVHGDTVSAMRDDGQGANFALDRVTRIYPNNLSISNRNIEKAFFEVYEGRSRALPEPKLTTHKDERNAAADIIDTLIAQFANAGGDDIKLAEFYQLVRSTADNAELAARTARDIENLYEQIWLPFERRAKVLDHFGYLDFAAERVTESGKWLADVRVDRTLLVGEALRRGLFDELEPAAAAGLMASLAADSDRSYGELYLSDQLLDIISQLEPIVWEVSKIEWKFGITPTEELNMSAAAAAEWWAGGAAWQEIVSRSKAEEGDLFRLFARTAEALMQIAHVHSANSKAASVARTAADRMLREPVR